MLRYKQIQYIVKILINGSKTFIAISLEMEAERENIKIIVQIWSTSLNNALQHPICISVQQPVVTKVKCEHIIVTVL